MAGGFLLPPGTALTTVSQYAPSSLATYNLDSGSLVALDSTNITISRTIPASGKVLVKAEITIRSVVTANFPQSFIGLVTHGTSIQVGYTTTALSNEDFNQLSNNLIQLRWHGSWLLTGLTPGNTLSLDLAYSANTVSTFTAFAGQVLGPALMSITDQ